MSITNDGVSVKIAADTAGFAPALDKSADAVTEAAGKMQASMARIGQQASTLRGTMTSVSTSVTSSFAELAATVGSISGIFAGISTIGFVDQVRRAVGTMADLDDLAEKAGVSVEALSATINTLAPAGHSIEAVSGALLRLTRAMANADVETADAAGAFKALGVTTRDSSGNLRAADEVLRDVAQALAGYADGTNKTAIAQAIFGRQGAELLPMLKDLATMQQQAASVSTEQAAAAEKLEKSLGTLRQQSVILGQSIASTLIPKLQDMIDQFRVGTDAAGGFFRALGRYGLTVSEPTTQIERLMGRLDELNAKLQRDRALAQGEGAAFGGGARNAAAGRVAAAQAEIDQINRDLQYWRLLAEQQGKGTNLRSPRLYDADGVQPQAPNVPRTATGDRKAGADPEAAAVLGMQRELALYGEVSDAAKVLWETENGRYKDFSAATKATLLLLAQSKDQAAAAEAVRKAAQAEEEADNRAMAALRDTAVRDLKRQNEEIERTAQKWIEAGDPLERYARKLSEVAELKRIGALTGPQASAAEDAIRNEGVRDQNEAPPFVMNLQSAFSRLFQSVREGTLTMRSFLSGAFETIAGAFTQMVAKMGAEWVAGELFRTAATKVQTSIRTATEVAGAETSMLASAQKALAEIANNAASAASAAFSAIAGIPYVGPFLAPAAAVGALAGAGAFANRVIHSAAGGFDIPAGMNPMTQLHEREMVLPAKQADVIRDMAEGGGSRGGGVNVNISALDGASVQRVLLDNPGQLRRALKGAFPSAARRNGFRG